ncbi:hydroxymethylglutaryl-CoA reductase, degradative [Oceanivirga miroungae]|uniref:3-hydroxy-3-methylglutaryl coenzyme A reductase n=1 Tax=Oceanivirga miroungae TaxID=1130046 RepID=A0A6I8M978_9FUSO|nr:hydroxymethylglutaryl-CoA reductase, degradative [Oceanivirga miroungae]VWL84838.1 hydroxymethylglutaryl-CoA reductase, degradative [Oceanivirga miroungae]
MENKFGGYYKKSREERIKILKDLEYIDEKMYNYLIEEKSLENYKADKMIENELGIFGIPFGIATNFLINGKEYIVPMATEEPSVIAAASNGAKIIAKNGGITSKVQENRQMIGQICLYDIDDFSKSLKILEENKEKLINLANKYHEGINNLGGGAKDIKFLKKGQFIIIYLYVDTLDAMGANILNTMLEGISFEIENLINAKKLMAIISNYSLNTIVKASCKLKVDSEYGNKMMLAYEFAKEDVYRAVTNNKGVLNGISALTLVTGNDTRAIEACIHSYASKDGKYMPLTKWEYKEGYLHGSIEIPIPIATVGGSIGLNETTKIALNILKNPNAKKLSEIAAALGLVQNFAALNALVTDGIQKGHLKLHAKTIMEFLKANEKESNIVIEKMIKENKIEIEYAKKILGEIRNEYKL